MAKKEDFEKMWISPTQEDILRPNTCSMTEHVEDAVLPA